jgi:hypothetical protein
MTTLKIQKGWSLPRQPLGQTINQVLVNLANEACLT